MGIANIINTAGGGGGGGSEIITNLVNSVDGAGLRLANQGYISCADVSANRFGTNDFSVEFVLSQETSAINADIFISNLNGSNQAVDAAVIRWDVIQNDNIQLVFTNSSATETAYNFGYDPAPDLNEPTHYLVSADRSGNAVLYRNGAEIASVSIAASGSANVGNSGQPTVIGSPVNNFGVKGNVYRFRTYSKALSSDEAKNVFDRADVPTALVSNLLLDLDCAYANPTQSTVIQDRGPNNQDGTLNGTITQTNVIKQLNSVSARIGTSGATPADGQLMVSGPLNVGGSTGTQTIQVESTNGYAQLKAISGSHIREWAVDTAGNFYVWQADNSLRPLNLDANGNVGVGNSAPSAPLEVSKSAASTVSAISTFSETDADHSVLQLKKSGSATVGTKAVTADGEILGRIDAYGVDTNSNQRRGAQIEFNQAAAATGSKVAGNIVFKTSSTSANDVTALTIDSSGLLTAKNAIALDTNTTPDTSGGEAFVYKHASNGTTLSGYNASIETGSAGSRASRLTISSTGLATFSNGINLGDQTMSSYQTGTWNPLMYYQNPTGVTIGGTAYASQSVSDYTASVGHYVRVGKLVHVEGYVKVTVANTGSFANDNIGISGLPFAHRNLTNANCLLMVNTSKNWGNTVAGGMLDPNSTVAVWQTSSGGGNLADDVGAVTNLQVWINGTYFTEA